MTRIHFDGKEEYRFVQSTVPSFSIVQVHPVLVDYQFAWESIFLAGPCQRPQEILNRLNEVIATTLQNWHDASRYLNPQFDMRGLLLGGSGKLLSAPIPVSSNVCDMLASEGLRFTRLAAGAPRWPREALVADKNFVVARSFRLEQLSVNNTGDTPNSDS